MYVLDMRLVHLWKVVAGNATDFIQVFMGCIIKQLCVFVEKVSTLFYLTELNSTEAWRESATLSEGRCYPGCTFSDEHGLVISGGMQVAFQAKATVENTLDGKNIASSIPQLPEKVMGHCLVALEGGDLFTAGGVHYDLVSRPMQFAVTGNIVDSHCLCFLDLIGILKET